MHLFFIHGWGFGPDIWQPVLQRLDYRIKTTCIDIGFFGEPDTLHEYPDDAVCIGHSLGVLWLLKYGPRNPKAFISISGFDRFVPHIDRRIILAMQKGLERNAGQQLEKFWTASGIPDYTNLMPPRTDRLKEGLDWLATWDERNAHINITCPKLVIASRDDQIVPGSASCDIWGSENIVWSETGGHMLPLTKPDMITDTITEFINELR